MARLAEALPIALVPKQRGVAAMGDFVVDDGCWCHPAGMLALPNTEWMFEQVAFARLLPAVVIHPLMRSRSILLAVAAVFLLVLLTIANTRELPAPGVIARFEGARRHAGNKKPRRLSTSGLCCSLICRDTTTSLDKYLHILHV